MVGMQYCCDDTMMESLVKWLNTWQSLQSVQLTLATTTVQYKILEGENFGKTVHTKN